MRGADRHVRLQRLVLLLIVVTAMVATGFAYLRTGKWQEARQEADLLDKELGNPNKLRREVSNLRNSIVTQRLKIQHLELNVPTRDYIPTMLGELEQMGLQAGLRITGVRPQPTKVKKTPPKQTGEPSEKQEGQQKEPPKPYDELDINVEAQGQFPQVLAFLESVSRFPKIIAVRSVTVTTRHEYGWTGPPRLDITFGIRAYIFKTQASALASKPQPAETEATSGG
jgi:Tfp pilus assembly protein PilO